MVNKVLRGCLRATESVLMLGDYTLGSPHSGAAAQTMIVEQIAKRDTLMIVTGNGIPGLKIIQPNITEWREGPTAGTHALAREESAVNQKSSIPMSIAFTST